MNYFTLAVMTFLTLSPAVAAQDSTMLMPLKGKFVLQFRYSGLSLYEFAGRTFSLKYHVSDAIAWRFGASVSGEKEMVHTVNDTGKNKHASQSIELYGQILNYMTADDGISFFYGAGLSVSGGSSNNDWQGYRYSQWTAGADGFVGVEWFFRRSMSLSGEYGLSVRYVDYSSTNYQLVSTTKRSVTVGSGNMFKVGVSVYF